MIDISALWGFVLVVGLLTLTPGLDTVLLLRTAALGRRRRAWGVVLGIQTGTLAWGVLTSLGVTALLTASHLAYAIVRWMGAAYLVWLGGRMLWEARRRTGAVGRVESGDREGGGRSGGPDMVAGERDGRGWSGSSDTVFGGWRQGALTNLLNPKVGAFYVALLPQFIPAGSPQLAAGVALAGIHVALGVLWSCVLIGFARILRDHLQRDSTRRLLDRIAGTVIGVLGVRLALGD
ncbi:LysE family translocator [Streptomyces sp. TRM66268-LWL]|uniref:LysE family translocator n=1 Tax=Streptomyces polyasparticus TaxID=2767826 RepID=A0ABR7SUZ4_9ACTN|nr:LysE family translocator [Streptomyces polyasparticus]MBC9719329.1 LysE family translocator [Streptomyces polyasparticus]